MKTIKEQADELVNKLSNHTNWEDCENIKCAILSTKNTIEVLQNRKQNQNFVIHIILNEAIDEQTEILKELESMI